MNKFMLPLAAAALLVTGAAYAQQKSHDGNTSDVPQAASTKTAPATADASKKHTGNAKTAPQAAGSQQPATTQSGTLPGKAKQN